ncbi:hypothetical protein CSA37_02970 [Candidatus Fermentibacteria bacterium]|nr:MAG: hypothetical protein CSA37_02970 [Candidatus Fermentibacteria bacterium]
MLFNPLELIPAQTELFVVNNTGRIISSCYCLVSGCDSLSKVFDGELTPDSSAQFTIPCRHMSRIIFHTTDGTNYRVEDFSPSTRLTDTLSISLAEKEFGGFLDIIGGSNRFTLVNSTPLPVTGLFLEGAEEENLLGPNPLMTSETACFWADQDTLVVKAQDISGRWSNSITLVKNNISNYHEETKVYIESFAELPSDNEKSHRYLLSCLYDQNVYFVEIHPISGIPVLIDLTSSPLGTWEMIDISSYPEPSFIVCEDQNGRSYSINTMYKDYSVYIVDCFSLDFDFSFPSGRN